MASNKQMEEDDSNPVNILVNSFAGLGPCSTFNFVISRSTTWAEFFRILSQRIRLDSSAIYLSNFSNQQLWPSAELVATSVSSHHHFGSLRLSTRLRGGKGGFGSQLRAAGGRMSSRKRRHDNSEAKNSSRNLDGRRVRIVHEAKALVEYLSAQPEAAKKARHEQRMKWTNILETSTNVENKDDRVQIQMDDAWTEMREESGERVRDAISCIQRASISQPGSDIHALIPDNPRNAKVAGTSISDNPAESAAIAEAHHSRYTGFDDDEAYLSKDEHFDA